MTERSRRRDAEMNVIAKAVEFVESDNDTQTEYVRLVEAVRKYRDFEMESVGRTVVPFPASDTSAEAAASVERKVGPLAQRCWDLIRLSYESGKEGLTCDDLEVWLQGRHQTVSPRVNELRDKGWIVDSGKRRRTRSGRLAIVWRPTSMSLHPSIRS